jgi:hypothetical protein
VQSIENKMAKSRPFGSADMSYGSGPSPAAQGRAGQLFHEGLRAKKEGKTESPYRAGTFEDEHLATRI